TITGKGNYSGTITKTFSITAIGLTSSNTTVSGITNKTYTGSAITQNITVTYGGKTLVNGTDYTVSYSNNTNVGTATVSITGKGNYSGTVNKTFTISAVVTPAPTTAPTQAPTQIPTNAPTSTPVPKPTTTPAPASEGVQGFCERLYTCALDRGFDDSGIKTWVGVLESGQMNGAEVAAGFFFSEEFQKAQLSDEEFVKRLYKTFMNREPDAAGYNTWINYMREGHSRREVFDGFINSTEWANICLRYGIDSGSNTPPSITIEPSTSVVAFATRLYSTCLGRTPEKKGVADWSSFLANRKVTGTEAAYGFFFSSEFLSHNYGNEEYVDRLYRTFMGREADPDGKALWLGLLESGEWSREDVFYGFAGSEEFGKICSSYGIRR
ncbi:MAG: DUF4214 domain-containing protein, partial [Saccharofermentans sp.]|nr:DUF4214 domain-containing protein [Saccharofermentans sp.]